MVSRRVRHRLAIFTSWVVAALVVAIAVVGFAAITQQPTVQAIGLRNAPPTSTPVAALVPTPTPEPELIARVLSPWEERRLDAEVKRQADLDSQYLRIQDAIDFAAADIESWSSDAVVSISVVLFDQPGRPFEERIVGVLPNLVAPSASLAKAYWVAVAVEATIDDDGVADETKLASVERRATPIFTWSSNDASTSLISTVGVDEINGYTDSLGMTETFLTQWASGQRAAQSNPYGTGNTTSTSDAVRFLDTMREARRIDPVDPVASVLLDWMRLAPDDMASGSFGGVFTDRLPAAVQPLVAHKAGWLPPACCKTEGNTLNAMGLIDLTTFADPGVVPDTARSYALAISVTNGRSYAEHASFISWTSCLVFQTLIDTSHGCGTANDTALDEPA